MTYVKICGLTNLPDALAAAESGADYLGFILYEKSPRFVQFELLPGIFAGLPSDVQRVGVFVDEQPDTVERLRRESPLSLVQLHGHEPPATLNQVQNSYKAVRPQTILELNQAIADYAKPIAKPTIGLQPDLLIDTYHPALMGGTGAQISREIALEAQKSGRRIMLAGGLTPDNIADMIRAIRPFAVDVSSGVEASPGKKDHGKLRAFIQAVREADRVLNP